MKQNTSKHVAGGLILFTLVAFMAPGVAGGAQSVYKDKETTYDLFAGYLAAQHGFSQAFERYPKDGTYGGGIGVNYFSSQRVGIGTDISISNNRGAFIDSTTANLILRLPMGGLAPYVFGGGGSSYEPSTQWIGQFGFGLEYRTKSRLGFFVDGRYVWGQKSDSDTSLLRAGLRLVY
jgi:hypothetical protein